MRFGRELIEPWGLLLAATSAGIAWAVDLPVTAIVGTATAVLVARAGVAALGRSEDQRAAVPPKIDERSPEGQWLRRARAAATHFESTSNSLTDGPLAGQLEAMGSSIRESVTTLHRLAGRASATNTALGHVDVTALAAERSRITAGLSTASDDVRADLEQAMAAVQAQEDVHTRLAAARNKLLAQLQAGALGLEGLVARVIELSTTTAYANADIDAITDLTDQLEGIRCGIIETEQATRHSLEA